jgi:hypothetical protein
MGFFEMIFGEGKKEVVSETKYDLLTIENVESIISKKSDEIFGPFISESNKLYGDIQSAIKNLRDNINTLSETKYTERVDTELLQNVVSHRASFIRKMEIMIRELKKDMKLDVDSIIAYNQAAKKIIHETNENTLNDYRYVDRLFEKEGEIVIKNFKDIGKISDSFESMIRKNENINIIKKTGNEIAKLKSDMVVFSQKNKELDDLEKYVSISKSNLEKVYSELRNFEEGSEWEELKKLLDKRNAIKNEISVVIAEINKNISKVEKSVRKFKNLVERGNEKIFDEKLLEKYVGSFFDTLINDGNSSNMNYILEATQKTMKDGKIEIKDMEKEIDEINFILGNDVFGNLLKEYFKMKNALNEVEKNIIENHAQNKRSEIEDRIKDEKKSIEISIFEIEKTKKQKEKIEKSINENKDILEKSLKNILKKEIKLK